MESKGRKNHKTHEKNEINRFFVSCSHRGSSLGRFGSKTGKIYKFQKKIKKNGPAQPSLAA